jgi:hypothetical protein
MKLACLAALILVLPVGAQIPPGAFQPGKGSYTFEQPAINQGRPLRVFYSVPVNCKPDAPVLMVMHGVQRDADRYRDDWTTIAERHGAVLVCPEFSKTDFPSDSQYNFGNVYGDFHEETKLPAPLPEAQWTFTCLDPIFDAVAARLKLKTPGYLLYGHSAGSQFVHRMLFFKPNAKALRTVSANAGWYMFPDPAVAFPYGTGGTNCDDARLRRVLGLPITILLGDQDIDPNHKQLRRTPGAMAQGPFRFARGKAFFEAARKQAERLKVPFAWQLVTAPGVAHHDKGMSVHAEAVLFPKTAPPALGPLAATASLRVLFAGDLGWGESYQDAYEKAGKGHILKAKGYDYSLEKLEPLLKSAQVVVANLETPVAQTRTSPFTGQKDYIHYSDPVQTPAALLRHNINVVGLANNHTVDLGQEGLTQTLATLSAKGVATFGAGMNEEGARAPWHRTFQVGSQSFSLYVLTAFEYREAEYDTKYQFYAKPNRPGVASIDLTALKHQVETIRKADKKAFVVYFPHWGQNYKWRNAEQTATAHGAIDAGVDLVLGHGAHMMGEIEQYKDHWIAYSIGNFVFNSAGRFAKNGVDPFGLPAVLEVAASGALSLELHPIVSDNALTQYQPRPVNAEEFDQAKAALLKHSPEPETWGTKVQFENTPDHRCVRVTIR